MNSGMLGGMKVILRTKASGIQSGTIFHHGTPNITKSKVLSNPAMRVLRQKCKKPMIQVMIIDHNLYFTLVKSSLLISMVTHQVILPTISRSCSAQERVLHLS